MLPLMGKHRGCTAAWPAAGPRPPDRGGTRRRCPSAAWRRLPDIFSVCSRPSAPSAPASARRPLAARGAAAGGGPPSLRGFGCRLRRHRGPPSVPAVAPLPRPVGACARPALRRRVRPPSAALRARLRAPPARSPVARPGPPVALAPLRAPWRAPCAWLGRPPAPGRLRAVGPPGAAPSASLRGSGSASGLRASGPRPLVGRGPWRARLVCARGPGAWGWVPPPAGGGCGSRRWSTRRRFAPGG